MSKDTFTTVSSSECMELKNIYMLSETGNLVKTQTINYKLPNKCENI